jgi:hypothetical protein
MHAVRSVTGKSLRSSCAMSAEVGGCYVEYSTLVCAYTADQTIVSSYFQTIIAR